MTSGRLCITAALLAALLLSSCTFLVFDTGDDHHDHDDDSDSITITIH